MIQYGGSTYNGAKRELLYESYTNKNNQKNRDVYVVREGVKQNFCIRYCWLHALHNMLTYIESDGVSYTSIANKNDGDYIELAIKTCDICENEVGTFTSSDNAARKISDIDVSAEVPRARSAFKSITGYDNNDEYGKKIANARKELQAAYDYGEKTAKYGKDVYIRDDFETKSKYTSEQINHYWERYGNRYCVDENKRDELIRIWEEKTGNTEKSVNDDYWDGISTTDYDEEEVKRYEEEPKIDKDKDTVFLQPVGSANGANGVEDAINDAESFVTSGNSEGIIADGNLQEFSQNLYSILLSIGVVISVIIGVILGVKLMLAPIGERAEAKKLLIPYAVGCVIVFGAFGIWKLVVTIMQGM